jgi:hypothetical protein
MTQQPNTDVHQKIHRRISMAAAAQVVMGGLQIQTSQGRKLARSYSTRSWWCMSVIPARREVEGGGAQSRTGPGKKIRPYLKNN